VCCDVRIEMVRDLILVGPSSGAGRRSRKGSVRSVPYEALILACILSVSVFGLGLAFAGVFAGL